MYTWQETTNQEVFDTNIPGVNNPLLQSYRYGVWQETFGKTVRRFCLYQNETLIGKIQFIQYPFGTRGHYWYAPYGPVITDVNTETEKLIDAIRETVTTPETIFIRIDAAATSTGWRRIPKLLEHTSTLQPRREWYIDATQPEEKILAEMHQKTRYNIRLAEKKGLMVTHYDRPIERFEQFYELQEKTSLRNHFTLHPRKYYETIIRDVSEQGIGTILEVTYNDTLLASHLLIRHADTTHYLFGGSGDLYKELMPSYLAQWRGIQYAHSHNTQYNMGGISNPTDTKDKLDALTHFKTRFGGYEIVHTNTSDYVIKPYLYYLYLMRALVKKILKK